MNGSLALDVPGGLRRLPHRALRLGAEWLVPPALLVLHGPPAPRRAALTFDDGPDDLTGRYLEVLARHHARATFFVVGEQCARHPDALVEILAAGHELGHHGFQHRRFTGLSRAALSDELRRTAELLPPPRSARPLVRPPNGHASLRSLLHCAAAGYRTVLWSLDSDDCRTEDPEVVVRRLAPAHVHPGEIVLLHEGQGWTLEALPRALAALTGDGYELVTVSELLAGDSS